MIIVCCKHKKYIGIPEGMSCELGDVIPCPASCTGCADKDKFTVEKLYNYDMSQYKPKFKIYGYDGEEAADKLGVRQGRGQNEAQTAATSRKVRDGEVPTGTEHSKEDTLNKYRNMFGGGQNGMSAPKVQSHELYESDESDKCLKSCRTYDKFVIGGKIFSDKAEIKTNFNAQPLKYALREIFNYWITSAVFSSGNELQDEFIWLVTTLSRRKISLSDVDKILSNDEYTLSHKFFYLFYDVIFRYEPPRGFYWCEQRVSLYPLSAVFKDKQDFVAHYCCEGNRGARFREFYRQHKNEVLHFLGCPDEQTLFDDATLIMAKSKKCIVLIDEYNEYTPIHLGSVAEFKKNMLAPTQLSLMQNMVNFLQKYYFSPLGVTRRVSALPFEKSTSDAEGRGEKLEEDESMYKAAKLISSSSYATEYDCYMTLVKEYVRVFSPSVITIGELRFTKNNYSEEIKEIIYEFCKAHFGQVDEEDAAKLQGRAWLAKSIYERGILVGYDCENKTDVEECISLISPKNFNLSNYYKIFGEPMFTFGKTDLSMHDYIKRIIDCNDVYAACGEIMNDERINEFFAARIKKDFMSLLNEDFLAFQRLYEEFIAD